MFDVQAIAIRTKIGVTVAVAGLLENGCKRAEIVGTYPGTIFHIVDPGHCELFINEYTVPGLCPQHVVPWFRSVLIPDLLHHSSVNILINDMPVKMVTIQDAPKARLADAPDWIVTALIGAPIGGPYYDCAIHHHGDIILGIYQTVFGPATRAACAQFVQNNCNPHRR